MTFKKSVYIYLLKRFFIVLLGSAIVFANAGCSLDFAPQPKPDNGKLRVITTVFPAYDFLRQIGKNRIDLRLLLRPGQDCHMYEPSPQDIIAINNCNVFVYVGGDSDAWVKSVLSSIDLQNKKVVTLMSCVKTLDEQETAEMTVTHSPFAEEEAEPDEHVWTSPRNAIAIVKHLSAVLCEADPKNAAFYEENTARYIKKLQALDAAYWQVVKNSKRHEIVVGDRFPLRYLTDEYGIKYYAAFPGCSSATEANAATIAALCRRVRRDHLPVVFHIELSNQRIARTIAAQTGAKVLEINSLHNLSRQDFENNATYISVMYKNLKALKEALND